MNSTKYSLRWELLFDLALLTFCALILSAGLLVLLLRVSLPEQMLSIAELNLRNVHSDFVGSKDFDSIQQQPENLRPALIESAFKKFIEERSLEDSFSLSVLSLDEAEQLNANGIFRQKFRRFLFFVPTLDRLIFDVANSNRVMRFEYSFDPLHSVLSRFKYFIFLASILITVGLVFFGYHLLFRKNILIPLKNLSDTANSFLEENWRARCEVHRRDELGNIGEVLNEMADKIQEKERKLVLTIQSLQKANEEIEATKNEQLQIEKLASVGRLAAGVAHEVGNPLGAISGYVDILRRALRSGGPMTEQDIELCDRIEGETNRISRIIRALLQQARPAQDRIRLIELEPVIRQAIELAQISSGIRLSFDFEAAASAYCERDQLLQVVLNLIINAKHAIEAKIEAKTEANFQGEIKVKLASRRLPSIQEMGDFGGASADVSMLRGLKGSYYWVLSITDNGIGIDSEDQKKLFEPFFSTKEPGKGTGLGLYVAKSIVESFRGAMIVQSAKGYGASFSVLLPQDL
jgi:signal transduction histidine kinase